MSMALKAMVFFDGRWIYHHRQHVISLSNMEDFEIDYKKIPRVIAKRLKEQTEQEIDVVKSCYFASIPVNRPGFDSSKQESFYDFLASECLFDTEIYDVDFRNNPEARPRENCVDIALVSSMMFYAAIPGAFDIAVVIAGDVDYHPAIRKVRQLGKRVQLMALRNRELYHPTSRVFINDPSLFDFPIMYLDDYLTEIRLVREPRQRACDKCGAVEVTTWAGINFYCTACRAANQAQKQLRVCDDCGKEEETNWDKPYFYCGECRENYRKNKPGVPGTGLAPRI
jgi:uncharacterized LabA/DUF88 family protein